jgi:DNA-directed RNA polymerase specialized sigma subunit
LKFNHLSKAERNQQILTRFFAGETQAAIAESFGISARRVSYIIKRAIDGPDR